MKILKRLFLLSIILIMVGIGVSLTLKAAIGVGAWDALAQSSSYLFGIKVGTVGMILNCSCVLGQGLLLRKNFRFKHLLQVPVSILIGVVINFFFYNVLGSVTIDSYIMKLTLLLIALFLLVLAIASMMVLDMVTFPLEGFCMAIANKIKRKFVVIRQGVDILCILLVVVLTFALSLPLTLREGTIFLMLFFAPLIGYFMKKVQPIFNKYDLLIEEVKK